MADMYTIFKALKKFHLPHARRSNPGWGRDIQHPARSVQGLTEAPVQWIPCLFHGKRPAHDVDHTIPSNNEVKERVELQLYSTSGLP